MEPPLDFFCSDTATGNCTLTMGGLTKDEVYVDAVHLAGCQATECAWPEDATPGGRAPYIA